MATRALSIGGALTRHKPQNSLHTPSIEASDGASNFNSRLS